MDALPTAKQEKIKLLEINEYLTCPLCKGYYIDATTISECLHSFCRSCIIQFLQENSHCPICEVIINKAKPNIKLDKTLQDIVYKLVPELFLREMASRQKFYGQHQQLAAKVTPEERGEDTERTIFNPKDLISLSIEYISDDSTPGAIKVPAALDTSKNSKNCDSNDSQMKRFLQCPGMCRIEVLKKFVQNKYNVNTVSFHIEILYKRVPLPNHYTLIDIAYIYSWKRNEPMKFFFRIMEKSAVENSESAPIPEIFVKPPKPSRNSEKSKAHRTQNKRKLTSPVKKILDDKNDVIINTDKIKDEIKNKLQDIGKGPVYTNITLNRSSNLEIITKVQKVSNKNGQPIGLNIIKQTVKKTSRLTEKPNQDKSVEKVTNGCKTAPRLKSNQNNPEESVNNSGQNPKVAVKQEEDAQIPSFDRKNDNKENQTKKTEEFENTEKPLETAAQNLKQEKDQKIDTNNTVVQAVFKKKDVELDEEKSNFLKSIELTARSALQTIQDLKPPDKPPSAVQNSTGVGQKSSQKRKSCCPVKNEKRKPKKTKSPIKIQPKDGDSMYIDKLLKFSEKQTSDDLQSLFNTCKINIPSSLSITLKESSEDDRDRRNVASLKPVQNYIEILKLPDSNLPECVKNDLDNRFQSKSSPNLSSPVGVKDGVKQQTQSFQKMFEESIKKIECTNKFHFPVGNNKNDDEENVVGAPKRNLTEFTSQLHKKTKLEGGKEPRKMEILPKIPIPRLKNASPSAKGRNQGKFQQTFANLHSASLGLNYTVSIAQNSGKFPAKIEAKVENSLRSPIKIDDVKMEEPENLIKKEEKIDGQMNGKVFVQTGAPILNLPNLHQSGTVKNSPRSKGIPNRQPNITSSPRPNMSPRSNPSPRPNMSPRSNLSPRPNISPRSNLSPRPNISPIPIVPAPKPKMSPEKTPGNPTPSVQNPGAFNPNHILEKYNIQNLAQLTASLNFNSAVFGMNHTSQLAALQQAMLLKQFEMHNRQNWQLSQYEKYLQNRLLSKEN